MSKYSDRNKQNARLGEVFDGTMDYQAMMIFYLQKIVKLFQKEILK